jgi:hypothetical protein
VGFYGGEWRGREFLYNRSVTNVNVTVIHNYYNRTVVVNNVNRVSFNGGPHGIQVRESERERMAAREHHFEARREQIDHEHAARADRGQWASVNHGRPTVAASGRPGEFHRDVVAARNEREAEHRNDRAVDRREDRREDRPVERRDDHRNDRPSIASSPNREVNRGARNDRPANVVNRDSERGRPNTAPSNNARQAREIQTVPNGNSRAPQGEARGNPHVDRAPAQHSNASHESAPHSNNKQEHGKPEKP